MHGHHGCRRDSIACKCSEVVSGREGGTGEVNEGRSGDGKKENTEGSGCKNFARKALNSETIKANLPRILRSRGMTEVEIVGHNLFIISFSLDVDKTKALEEGPWHFFQDLMTLKQTKVMQTPFDVSFEDINIWVQCHNVPISCMEPNIIRRIEENRCGGRSRY